MTTQPRVRIVIAVTFFAYVLLIRTYDLANSFQMLGEQTRDWAVALGSWTDLPLTGAPSTAGQCSGDHRRVPGQCGVGPRTRGEQSCSRRCQHKSPGITVGPNAGLDHGLCGAEVGLGVMA